MLALLKSQDVQPKSSGHAKAIRPQIDNKRNCSAECLEVLMKQLPQELSRSKLSVLTVSVSVSKLTVLTVYRFDRLPFIVLTVSPFWFHCFALSRLIFTGRFAVLSVSVLPFCRSVSPFCRSRFAVLANSVLIPFTVLTAESLIKSIPFCRFRFDRFDAHFLLPI